MALDWETQERRDRRIEEILGEVGMLNSSFDMIQLAVAAIQARLTEMNDDPDGLYNEDDRPKLLEKLTTFRAALSAWEDSIPGG